MDQKKNYKDKKTYLEKANVIYSFTKKGSQYIVNFVEDPEDSWFIYEVKIKKQSKEYESVQMIVRKNLNDWVESYEGRGWKNVKE